MSNYTDATRKLVAEGFYDEPDKIDFAIDECLHKEFAMPDPPPAGPNRVRLAGNGELPALIWGDLGERGAVADTKEPRREVFVFYLVMIALAVIAVAVFWDGR